jgi:hypothetical protein
VTIALQDARWFASAVQSQVPSDGWKPGISPYCRM